MEWIHLEDQYLPRNDKGILPSGREYYPNYLGYHQRTFQGHEHDRYRFGWDQGRMTCTLPNWLLLIVIREKNSICKKA